MSNLCNNVCNVNFLDNPTSGETVPDPLSYCKPLKKNNNYCSRKLEKKLKKIAPVVLVGYERIITNLIDTMHA